MPETYNVDFRHVRDFSPIIPGYEEIETVSLTHCQSKIPDRPHTPIRFVGVVPRNSIFARKGFKWMPNCVNDKYINNIFATEIEGIFCQAWAVVEPE